MSRCCCWSFSSASMADSGLLFPPAPPSSFTSPSARSLCFRCPQERQGGCHHDGHLVITSYCLSSSVVVPLVFHPPTPPPPPPPLPILALLIVVLHPLPLMLFLIVVSHLVVVVGPSLLPQWPIVGCRSHCPLLHHLLPPPIDHCVSVVLRTDGAVVIMMDFLSSRPIVCCRWWQSLSCSIHLLPRRRHHRCLSWRC